MDMQQDLGVYRLSPEGYAREATQIVASFDDSRDDGPYEIVYDYGITSGSSIRRLAAFPASIRFPKQRRYHSWFRRHAQWLVGEDGMADVEFVKEADGFTPVEVVRCAIGHPLAYTVARLRDLAPRLYRAKATRPEILEAIRQQAIKELLRTDINPCRCYSRQAEDALDEKIKGLSYMAAVLARYRANEEYDDLHDVVFEAIIDAAEGAGELASA